MAARSSFQYEQQVVSTTARTATETDSTMEEMTAVERYTRIQRRDQAASDMVRRHLFASGGHIGEAVRSCRATLQFREEHQVNTRSKIWLESKRHVSHDPDGNDDDYCWMEHKCAAAESKSSILRLQGFDKRGRLNPLVKPSAASSSRKFARVDSLDASICMLEKAVALTEIKSCELPVGRSSLSDSQVSNESVVVTVNFDDFVPWRVQFLAVTNE